MPSDDIIGGALSSLERTNLKCGYVIECFTPAWKANIGNSLNFHILPQLDFVAVRVSVSLTVCLSLSASQSLFFLITLCLSLLPLCLSSLTFCLCLSSFSFSPIPLFFPLHRPLFNSVSLFLFLYHTRSLFFPLLPYLICKYSILPLPNTCLLLLASLFPSSLSLLLSILDAISLSPSLSLARTHSLTCSHTLSHLLAHILSLARTHSLTCSHTLSHSLTHTLSLLPTSSFSIHFWFSSMEKVHRSFSRYPSFASNLFE